MSLFKTTTLQPIKIIDCFIFYNELDLLTYRLNVLNDVVDYFVIVESTHTHVGQVKKLWFNENKQLFEQFQDKIIHIIVDDFPHKYPNINIANKEQWINENYQRNAISRGLSMIHLNDQDLITVTDLDEIPDARTLYKCKNRDIIVSINVLEMDLYYYNLHSKFVEKWNQSKIMSYKNYTKSNLSCQQIRTNSYKYSGKSIKNGGWHLSYFGDGAFIKNKIEQFIHQELNYSCFTDVSKIEEKIANCSDLFNRKGLIIKTNINDNNYLPPEYDKYLIKYF